MIANGAFGDRLDEIAALHGIARVTLRYAWGTLPNVRDVARALETDPDIAAAAMIQHETSVGIMNPVGEIGRLCRAQGVTSIVDAVSALGVEDVDVVRDGVDICYSSANKCLHSVSGVSFLCVAPEVWPRIAAVAPRVYYLDLGRHRRYLDELSQTPFTPAVSSFFALETALDELNEQGGVAARREVYRKRSLRIRRVFADLGFESFTNTGRESHTISMLRLPCGPDRRRSLRRREGARVHHLPRQGRVRRALHPDREHGRALRRDNRRRFWRRSPTWCGARPPRRRARRAPGAQVGLAMRAALFRRHSWTAGSAPPVLGSPAGVVLRGPAGPRCSHVRGDWCRAACCQKLLRTACPLAAVEEAR